MAQFTYYSSSDASGPGTLKGSTLGDMNRILRACLVAGYPGKAAAGWTEPYAESSYCAGFRQGAGSQMYLHLNDNAPHGASYQENVYATGWENLTAVGSTIGVGTGQFPLPAQSLTNGHVAWWKSYSNDATQRSWWMFADSRTMHLFIEWGYSAGQLLWFSFGDIYSFSSVDNYRCVIVGNTADTSFSYSYTTATIWSAYNASVIGFFGARALGGVGGSIALGRCPALSSFYMGNYLYGYMACPNPSDNAIWLDPLYVHEPTNYGIRGQMRGIYTTPQSPTNFSLGQLITGAGDLAGKTFQAMPLLQNPANSPGVFFVETSNTLGTN